MLARGFTEEWLPWGEERDPAEGSGVGPRGDRRVDRHDPPELRVLGQVEGGVAMGGHGEPGPRPVGHGPPDPADVGRGNDLARGVNPQRDGVATEAVGEADESGGEALVDVVDGEILCRLELGP